jgi:HAD superfamily hydrolase (TIGR01490 family)
MGGALDAPPFRFHPAATATVMRLVFFDLDGTISRRDTLVPYALQHALRRRPWRLLWLPRVLPIVIRFALGGSDRGELKGALIAALLGSLTRDDIDAWNESYLPGLLRERVFPAALERIREHRGAGDRLVLMSASVDLYVPDIGRRLGFDATICSGVAWHEGRVLGHLSTPNCRDDEKAVQLRAEVARHPGLQTVAYGNSASDLPHMVLAGHAVLVNPNAALRRAAEACGKKIEFVRWS